MNNLILDYMEQTAARLPEKTAFADEQTSVMTDCQKLTVSWSA